MTCVKNGLRCNGIVAWLGNTDQICRGEKKGRGVIFEGMVWDGCGGARQTARVDNYSWEDIIFCIVFVCF